MVLCVDVYPSFSSHVLLARRSRSSYTIAHTREDVPFLTAGHGGSHIGSFKVGAASPNSHVFVAFVYFLLLFLFGSIAFPSSSIFVFSLPTQASIVGVHDRACRQLSHKPCQELSLK